MIRKILTYYAGRLDEYLGRTHRQPEGLATVGLIGTAAEETPNKLVVSLVNLEKEATGDSVYMRSTSGNYAGTLAPLLLNMHIMLAAVYESKRYAESLSVLSDTLEFIQSMPRFETEGHDRRQTRRPHGRHHRARRQHRDGLPHGDDRRMNVRKRNINANNKER